MSSTFNKPTRSSQLRAEAAKARKVGSEATKPKPSSKPRPPPSYKDQDKEKGEKDEGDDAEKKIEEEEAQDAQDEDPEPKGKPDPKGKEPQRTKSSVRSTPAKKPDSKSAPHLTMLALTIDQSPMPCKVTKEFEYVPSHYRLFAAHSAIASLLCPLKIIQKDDPSYNPVYSRLALSLCTLYKILDSRERAGLITYDESKVIKKLRLAFDFEAAMIPGPCVSMVEAMGEHYPTDKRFDVICPKIPYQVGDTNNPEAINEEATSIASGQKLLFPHFPALLCLADQISKENVENEVKVTAATTTPAAAAVNADQFWHEKEFVLFNPITTTTSIRLWRNAGDTAGNNKIANNKALLMNSALLYPFEIRKDHLIASSQASPPLTLSYPDTNTTAVTDLLLFFGVKSSTRWIPTVMSSLEYEAKFFIGSATLGSILGETGQNILCVSKFQMDATAPTLNWHTGLGVTDDDVHKVVTMMESVGDGDMAVANLNATVVQMMSSANSSSAKYACSFDPIPVTDALHAYGSHTRRIIHRVPLIAHQFRTFIKTEMMKNVRAVLDE